LTRPPGRSNWFWRVGRHESLLDFDMWAFDPPFYGHQIEQRTSTRVISATMKVPIPSATSCPKANSDHSSASNMGITAPEQQQTTPSADTAPFPMVRSGYA